MAPPKKATPPNTWPLGEYLREQRGKMSIREAARRADISESRWRQVEAGYQRMAGGIEVPVHPRAETVAAMCRAISRGHLYFPGGWQPAKATAIPLTPRQSEVLALLAQGFPNKRICQSLNLTEHTVKTHLKAIFLHLGVHNRTECVSQARLQGWL